MTRQPIGSTRAMIVISMVVVAVLLLATSVQAIGNGDDPADTATVTYVVVGGDNLWSIAEGITPAGGDVRRTLGEIRRLNELDDTTIHVGDVLQLPGG